MEGRCKTCRHWWNWDPEYSPEVGTCELSREVFDFRAYCSEGGVLNTDHDFGCIHWEAEPRPQDGHTDTTAR